MAGDITLRGQTLSAVATISRANLLVANPVDLDGQTLSAVATISKAVLNTGGLPSVEPPDLFCLDIDFADTSTTA